MSNRLNYNLYQGLFSKARIFYFNKITNGIKQNDYILDIGCGQGDFLMACKNHNLNAIGIDSEEKWITYCKKLKLKSKQGTIQHIPFPDNTFDYVFCQSVLEHITDPITAIYEIKRVLKKGGTLIISSPTPENDFWDDPTHIRPYTPKSMALLFSMTNFNSFKINYVLTFLLGFSVTSPWIYKFLNLLPFAFGSNLICYAKK